MKASLNALLFCLFLGSAGYALGATLPDSCGDGKITYQVKTEKEQLIPPVPADGKAEVIFIERENQMVAPFHYATVRFGMDGSWVGANYDNSYFVFSIGPGEHHLCANWQSTLEKVKNTTDVTSFTAQPGATYYFAAQLTVSGGGDGVPITTFSLSRLDEDKGKFWLGTSKRSISKQR